VEAPPKSLISVPTSVLIVETSWPVCTLCSNCSICANSVTNCVPSVGLDGSWFLICATMSWRNVVMSTEPALELDDELDEEPPLPLDELAE